MKKLLFFIESLDSGGAEKSLTELIENLNKNKFGITVISETDGEYYTERVKDACIYRCFTSKSKHNNHLRIFINKLIIKFSIAAPAKIVHRILIRGTYDVEIAYCEGYATKLVANSVNKNSRKIAFVHTDMQKNHWTQTVFRSLEEETECYKKFDVISCVSESVAKAFTDTFGLTDKVVVNYNPVTTKLIIEKSQEPSGLENISFPRMITAGRLTTAKGYDRLLRIADRLKNDGYKFELLILGKGEEEQNLERFIKEQNLSGFVKLMGFKDNPYKYIADSDFFVCSSIAEGFSTIATECVILGKPVITTDVSGMAELFGRAELLGKNELFGKNEEFGRAECGIICENNEDALFDAIKYVLDNPSCLQKFSMGARERATFFNIENSVKNIEKLF